MGRVEHYEIARYGALIAWAKQVDMADAADLLAESLDEKLNALSESVNPTAARKEAA